MRGWRLDEERFSEMLGICVLGFWSDWITAFLGEKREVEIPHSKGVFLGAFLFSEKKEKVRWKKRMEWSDR